MEKVTLLEYQANKQNKWSKSGLRGKKKKRKIIWEGKKLGKQYLKDKLQMQRNINGERMAVSSWK